MKGQFSNRITAGELLMLPFGDGKVALQDKESLQRNPKCTYLENKHMELKLHSVLVIVMKTFIITERQFAGRQSHWEIAYKEEDD